MLFKNIIPEEHNDKKLMQSPLTGETRSSIHSELRKMLMIFSLTFLGTIKYLILSDIFLMLNPKSVVDDTFYSQLQFTKWDNII